MRRKYLDNLDDLLVVTVVANQTDSYHRLIRSLKVYGYKYEVYPQVTGNEKLSVLRENLARYKDDKKTVILVVDAYNVIFTQGPEFVLNKFENLKPARIVFGAEDICWPDEKLQYDYPLVEGNEKRFLNSGNYLGYAADIYQMISSEEEIKDEQQFFTKLFLKEANEQSIVLDKRADIFMNLHGATNELELPANGEDVYVKNSWTDSVPAVIHGNGPAKVNDLLHNIEGTFSCLESIELPE